MRFMALATDYDGTLARDGVVEESTIEAIEKLRKSGRLLLLVTGRELPELQTVFPRLDLFHCVVAENGGLLYRPDTREKRALAEPPNPKFIEALHRRNVNPLSVGEVIVASFHPHETTILEVIRELGLELSVIFNKDAVMVLPPGVNKLSGMKAALAEFGLSEHNVAGVGDAENDHAFLKCCECGVAVQNAVPAIKEIADFVTEGARGQGVTELIEALIADDLASYADRLKRHDITLGHDAKGDICLSAYGASMLVCGASGSGKSTLTAGFLESLFSKGYQVCLIDPEGDYESFEGAITVGDEKHAASGDQVIEALKKPSSQVVVNLVGHRIQERPQFFAHLFPRLQELRLKTGRPHWIVVDEAHHMFPAEWGPTAAELPPDIDNLVLITVHPENVARAALRSVDVVAVVGRNAVNVISSFASAASLEAPDEQWEDLPSGEAFFWFVREGKFRRVQYVMPEAERRRHKRKYAEGQLDEAAIFVFTGRQGQFKLRAPNLMTFLQLADGLDDDTWMFHLRRGDYSNWMRTDLKDEEAAAGIEAIEKNNQLDANQTRAEIRKIIEARYTAPA